MSRHRNVRNLDYSDLLDDEADADEVTAEDAERLDRAVEKITERLGSDFTLDEIKDTAWYYFFDVDKSTDYLLRKPPSSRNIVSLLLDQSLILSREENQESRVCSQTEDTEND